MTALDAVVWKYGATTNEGWRTKHETWGRSHVALYRRFRASGMPGPRARAVARRYAALAGHLALSRRDPRHALLATKGVAQARGRLAASWSSRTWYP